MTRSRAVIAPRAIPMGCGEQRYDDFVQALERRSFAIDELAGLIEQATGVDTRAVIDEWLRPLLERD
jgi:hypothetical protein